MSRTINADLPRDFKRIINSTEIFYHAGSDSAAMTTGRVLLVPIQIRVLLTIDRIGLSWGGVAAGNAILGLYRDMGDTPVGGAVVVQSASIAKSGTSRAQEFTIVDTQLLPGLYWVAVRSSEATSKYTRHDLVNWITGGTLIPRYYDAAYGVLTDPCPAVNALTECPGIYVRIKSIP